MERESGDLEMTGQMFLRTAQTEDRITELERKMVLVWEHLHFSDERGEPKPEPQPQTALVPDEPTSSPEYERTAVKSANKRRRA